MVTMLLLAWPERAPTHGALRLRPFTRSDLGYVMELATDPYVPLVSSLPAHADEAEALAWIDRQHERLTEGRGFSFCAADRTTDRAVGSAGLWTRGFVGGRATAGYSVAPSARGRGVATDALTALTAFGWTLPPLHRIELQIEPWNLGSRRVAERAGYRYEGLMRSHQQIGDRRRDLELWAALRPDP